MSSSSLFFVIKYIGDIMKYILLKDYQESMGEFINLSSNEKVVSNSIHISYDDLVLNHKEYLEKNKTYYLYCNGGVRSRKAYHLLKFKGYDVVVVLK